MKADCFKCKVPLVPGERTQEKPVSMRLSAYRSGTSRTIAHIPYRCPSCGKTRAVEGKEA